MLFKILSHSLFTITFLISVSVSEKSLAETNQAPDCTHAYPSKSVLWPPNHKFDEISINGISDPEGGSISTVIQCIKQDEPLNSTGDGNFAYDGSGVGSSSAFVRKERKGNSNGRVYHISYIATDNDGAQCEGTVQVSVPKKKKSSAVDEGPLYDSVENNGNTCGTGNLNNPPTALNQSLSVDEDISLSINLNGSDSDGDFLTFSVVNSTVNGTLIGDAQNLIYTPDSNYNGEDSFTFITNDGKENSETATVTINVNPVNDQPIAEVQTLETLEDTNLNIILSGSDIEQDELSYILISSPLNGSLTGTLPDLAYTPNLNFNGDDSFIFSVTDGLLESDEVEINLIITPSDDTPIANSQQFITNEDEALAITLFGTDIDNNILSYSVVTQPSSGTLSGNAPNLTYTPDDNFNGSDGFTFIVNDGSSSSDIANVIIFVNSVNDLPTVNAGSDQIVVEGDNVQLNAIADDTDGQIVNQRWEESGQNIGNNLSLILDSLSVGDHVLTAIVTDNDGGTASDSINVTVEKKPNIAPEALSETVTTNEDVSLNIILKGTDDNDNALTYSIESDVSHGTLLGVPPNITYRPNTNFSGQDTFSFTVNDGEISSVSASVEITVNSINDAPTINAGLDRTVFIDSPIDLTAEAKDVEGPIASYEWKQGETVIGDSQGLVLSSLALGEYKFTVKVTDLDGLSAEDSVTIIVAEDQTALGSISGKVVDETGVGIVNARVKLPTGESTVSDFQGDYIIDGVKPIERTAVTANRSGFLQNSDIIRIVSGMQTEQDIVMSRPKVMAEYEPIEGSMIETEGLTVEIPPAVEFMMESGKPFEGEVMINASYFPITTEEGVNEFPGDTMAINDEGEMGDLTSFGIIKLEANDQQGNPLELAEGTNIEVSIPADDSLDKPPTIPFWYWDEEKGMWIEDGIATYDPATNTYKTTVDTVATFNLDAFEGNIIGSLDVCIEDNLGNRLPGYVTLAPDGTDLWRSTAKTSDDGLLRLNSIVAQSNFNLYASSNDGRLGEYANNPVYITGGPNTLDSCIVIDNNNRAESFQLTGATVDGSGNAKPNVELMLFGEAQGQSFGNPSLVQILSLKSDANGNFLINLNETNPASTEVALLGNKKLFLKAIDGDTKISKDILIEKSQNSYNLGDITLKSNMPPFANAGLDISQYLGDRVALRANKSYDSDGSIVSYEWRENDTVIGSNQFTSTSDLSLGNHIIVLTVEDNFGLKTSDEINVKIISKEKALFADAGRDSQTYLNGVVSLNASRSISLGSPISYEWIEDGEVISNQRQFLYTPKDTDIHKITLKVTNTDGLEDYDEVVVSAYQPFEYIKAPLDRTIYLGDTLLIKPEGNYSNGLNLNFKWSEDQQVFLDETITIPTIGTSTELPGFSYNPSELGVHTLKLVITNQQGIQKTDTVNITVIEKEDNKVNVNAGLDNSIYLNQTTTLKGFALSDNTTIKTIQWSEDGNLLGDTLNIDYLGSSVGQHSIELSVTFEDDTVKKDNVIINVVSQSQSPSFSAYAGLDKTVYYRGTFRNTAIGYPESEVASIEWSVNGNVISETANVFYSSLDEGVYPIDLKLTSIDGKVAYDQAIYTVVYLEEPQEGYVDLGPTRNTYIDQPLNFVVRNGGDAFYEPCQFECEGGGSGVTEVIIGKGDERGPTIQDPVVHEWKLDGELLVGDEFNRNFISSVEFPEARSYLLEYKITGSAGLTFNNSVTINSFERPQSQVSPDVIANAGLDQNIYFESIVLDASNSFVNAEPARYVWTEDGEYLSDDETFTYRPTSPGPRLIQLTVYDDIGNSATDDKLITVFPNQNSSLKAFAGLDRTFYTGPSYVNSFGIERNNINVITGIAESTGQTTFISYVWTKNGEILSNNNRFLTEILSEGRHTLTLTVSDSQGNTDSDNIVVTMIDNQDKGIVVDAGIDTTIPLARELNISATAASHTKSGIEQISYDWSLNGTVISTSTNGQLIYKFPEVGEYELQLTGMHPEGFVESDTVTVTVVETERSIFADAGLDRTIFQGANVVLNRGASYSLSDGLTFEWSEDGAILSQTSNFTFVGNTLGERTFKLTVTDSEGLVDTDEVVITVIDSGLVDLIPPVITLNGEQNIILNVGDVYQDEGSTAIDDRDGVITGSIVTQNTLLTTFNPGNTAINYSVKDKAGNLAFVTRRITILAPTEPDTVAPVITLIGNNPTSIPQGRRYVDARATVLDNRDGSIGYRFNSNVNVDIPGTYQVNFTATDNAGNSSEASRTVNVIADPNLDTINPVIILIGETVVSIPEGDTYTDQGATASDNIDGDITAKITVDNTVDSDVVGQYFVNYTVTDTANNQSILTRTVIVTKVDQPDVLPPILVQSLEWLETQSQADGSYTNSARIALPIQSTSEVLRAYKRVEEVLAPGIPAALTYLNTDDSNKVEFLSRKIIAGIEAGNDVSIMILDLLEFQNIDRGFGDQDNYHSRVIDTAFALKALGLSDYSDTVTIGNVISYLRTQQSFNDGGFSHSSKNQSSVYETSLALIALQNYQDVLDLKSMIDSANDYLMSNQLAGGGWDSHWETAYALIAVTPTADNFASYQIAAERLKTGQLANGSWDNDVYTTALAIRALYKSENLDTP